jgi:hypothetical protein
VMDGSSQAVEADEVAPPNRARPVMIILPSDAAIYPDATRLVDASIRLDGAHSDVLCWRNS